MASIKKKKQEQKSVNCPKCHKDFTNPFDIFAIEKLERCVDCNKAWLAIPENDPDNKKFRFDYVQRDNVILYAKTEEEAIKEFEDNYEFDDYDIEEIK